MRKAFATLVLLVLVFAATHSQIGPSFFDFGDHIVKPSNPYVPMCMTITPDPVFWLTPVYSFLVLRFAYDPSCLDIEIANSSGEWISINALVAASRDGRVSGLALSQQRVILRACPEGFMGGYALNIFRDRNQQNPGKHIVELGIVESSSQLQCCFFGSIIGDEETGQFVPMRWRVLNLTPGHTCCVVPAIGYSGGNGQMVRTVNERSPFGNPPDGCFGSFTVAPVRNNTPPSRRDPDSIGRAGR